jgi:hypothetical protein
MVAAGANHSLCLTQRNDVFTCGYNAKGQLGLGDERSVTAWTHVQALKAKRVNTIYAGGDHSWAVLDEYDPSIKNYEPPSPIKLTIDISPQREPAREPQLDTVVSEMSSNRKLELILTEVELSHRFVHFVLRDKLVKNCSKLIDSYV